jgi:hypothetical protein
MRAFVAALDEGRLQGNRMNVPRGRNCLSSILRLIDNHKSSRREETKIAQGWGPHGQVFVRGVAGKRSAPLGKRFNSNAQPCRGGTKPESFYAIALMPAFVFHYSAHPLLQEG